MSTDASPTTPPGATDTSGGLNDPQLDRTKARIAHDFHGFLSWLETWWPLLGAVVIGLVLLAYWRLVRRLAHAYRHSDGMASYRDVVAVFAQRALIRYARRTRPGWVASRRSRVRFGAVGSRIGQIGKYRMRWVGASYDQPMGVMAPTQVGKTRRLIARWIIDATEAGTVLFASTKFDLFDLVKHYLPARVWVFDPARAMTPEARGWTQTYRRRVRFWQTHTVERKAVDVRWTPVLGCVHGDTAIRRAGALTGDGGKRTSRGGSNDEYFRGNAAEVLRCYLHAAALADRDMRTVYDWSKDFDNDEPVRILQQDPWAEPGWAETLQALLQPSRSRPDLVRTVGLALKMFASTATLEWACPPAAEQFDIDRFISSGDALFVLGSKDMLSTTGYTAMFVQEVIWRGRQLGQARKLEPLLTVVLDELTNIAPLPEFPDYLSDSAGRGVVIRWAAQGPSQARETWGVEGAKTIFNNTKVKVILAGLDDSDYLADLTALAGVWRPAGDSHDVRPVLPADQINSQRKMHALVQTADTRFFRVRLVDIKHEPRPRLHPKPRQERPRARTRHKGPRSGLQRQSPASRRSAIPPMDAEAVYEVPTGAPWETPVSTSSEAGN